MIRIEELHLQAGSFSLGQVDLEVHTGEYFALLGATGAGKTLFLECLAGLRRPHLGRIWVDGREVTRLPPEERQVGYVPQDYALFPHLSVEGNIAFGLEVRHMPRAELRSRVLDMATLLGLTTLLERSTETLSGGERQRVSLARALVMQPKVLLLDEPLSALDPQTKADLRLGLKRIHQELGLTILHVTHDFDEAFVLSQRMGVLCQGKLAQVGSREEVFYRPRNLAVAEFMGMRNIFPARVVEVGSQGLRLSWKEHLLEAPPLHVPLGKEVHFCIRPNEVMIVRPERPLRANIKENLLSGVIVGELARGALYSVYLRLDDSESDYDLEIEIPNHAYLRLGLSKGKRVTVSLKKGALHVIPE